MKLIIIAKPLSQIRFVFEMDEDLKGEFSNNEINNENLQKKLKQLKHSQGTYIGHITKTINKIDKHY